jgi:hypothetical protein
MDGFYPMDCGCEMQTAHRCGGPECHCHVEGYYLLAFVPAVAGDLTTPQSKNRGGRTP